MPVQELQPPYPAGIRCFYFFPNDDFRIWRRQFEALAGRYQWTNAIAKQFAFAYMRDWATQVVMDIPLHGSETIEQTLDAYQDRFSLVADLQQLQMQRGGTLRGHRRRCQPKRRRSLLKPRPKRGIPAPIRRPQVGRTGRVVRVPTEGGQLAELALPPDSGDTEMEIAAKRVMPPTTRTGSLHLPREDPVCFVGTLPAGSEGARDFPWGQ